MTSVIRGGDEPFPAPPQVALELPDGWVAMPNPEVIVAAGRAEWEGFRDNVCVTTERIAGLAALDEVGERVWQRFTSNPEFTGVGHELSEGIGGRPVYRMEGGFLMPPAGRLVQLCVLTVVPHAAVTDIVYVVGTAAASRAEAVGPSIRSIIDSAQLLEPVPVG